MSISLYMDQHVHAGIVSGLRSRAVDVLTAREDGMDRAADEELLQRSTELRRLLFTNDSDLLGIANEHQRTQHNFGGVAFAPQKGTSIGRLLDDLELISKAMSPDEVANQVIFLPF